MHRYFIKIPWLLRRVYPEFVWKIPSKERVVYLSFDDGPHPVITPFVLDLLVKFDARASFFCIGDNVQRHPDIYRRMVAEGHAVGNHTNNHLNGWKTDDEEYVQNIRDASVHIRSSLFRPPYGRIKKSQARMMKQSADLKQLRVIMWDVLSGDFDTAFTPEICFRNVVDNVSPGSVIVFHDSEKAFGNLRQCLPEVLSWLKTEGYAMRAIPA